MVCIGSTMLYTKTANHNLLKAKLNPQMSDVANFLSFKLKMSPAMTYIVRRQLQNCDKS